LLDAAYGDDDVPAAARAQAVVEWVARSGPCVLPTPVSGRSLELLAILPMPLAVAESMVAPLREQLAQASWIRPALLPTLSARLAAAQPWREGDPLPDRPLLAHDGMGLAGPSRRAVEEAHRVGRPILFTGHLPTGSPGERLVAESAADWLRLPTHPTLPENLAMVRATGARLALGHSCDDAVQARLVPHLPGVFRPARTGERFAL
ncbi:MAG TPA: MBL fold metallo-hydrolase, partial [Beijerinckiaceae bacterium]|nr:MBL fold metallo-hydrolase [Beijerinckiaceae bacterium]